MQFVISKSLTIVGTECSSARRLLAYHAWGSGFNPQHCINQAWCSMSAIPALRRWSQENRSSRPSLPTSKVQGQPGLHKDVIIVISSSLIGLIVHLKGVNYTWYWKFSQSSRATEDMSLRGKPTTTILLNHHNSQLYSKYPSLYSQVKYGSHSPPKKPLLEMAEKLHAWYLNDMAA